MRKTRKRSLSAAVIAFALSFGLAFSPLALNVKTAGAATQGFTNSTVAVSATNEALSGWQYYFYDPTHKKSTPKNGGFYYESDKMFLKAVADGHTGNGMLMERNEGTDEFVAYSYRFDVKANQTYKISAWVKTDCADNAKNKLTACIEKHTDSNFSAIGSVKEWTEYSFYHTTGASETSMVICLRTEGIGKFYIDDIAVKESTSYYNTDFFRMQSFSANSGESKSEDPTDMVPLTASQLSNESSDGDGKSLKLYDYQVFKTVFGRLPFNKNYTLSFKYKTVDAETSARLSIRMDNIGPDGARRYYVNTYDENNTMTSEALYLNATEWTEFKYNFSTKGGLTTQWLGIVPHDIGSGYYLIDELAITTYSANAFTGGTFDDDGYTNFEYVNSPAGEPTDGYTAVTADKLVDGENGKALKLDLNDYLRVNFGTLKFNETYRLNFKYKNAGEANATASIRMDHATVAGAQAWFAPNATGTSEWQQYSYLFTTNEFVAGDGKTYNSSISFVRIGITGGDGLLIDDLEIFVEDGGMQYIVNGSFSGAYFAEYVGYGGNLNFAKQPDGIYAMAAGNYSLDNTSGQRSYFRIPDTGLVSEQEYTLSFDYRSGANSGCLYYGGAQIAEWTGNTEAKWTHHTVTFTAASHGFLEMYGDGGIGFPTYYKNIQITDASGKTYLTNTTYKLPSSTEILGENVFAYGEFNGKIQNEWTGWTFENGGIYGLKFQDNNTDWKLNLFGTAEAAATAISDEIAVTANAIVVEQEFFQGEAKVTLIVGEKEIEATDDGVFVLPEGTTAVKVKYSASEYVAIKKIFIGSHVHGDDCSNVPVSNSEAIYEWSEDNKTCTATMLYICGAKSTVTETATAVITNNTATLYEKGTGLYTVTFEDNRFETQSKTAETEVRSPENVTLNVGETENGSVKLTVGDTAITEFPYTIMEKTEVTVTATAERGYKLVAITVNGVAIEGNTFTVDGAAVVSATFEKDPLFRSITAATAENGTVTVDVANAYDGETVTVTATAAEGYELDYITVNGETIEGNTFTVAGDATVSAVFKKLPEREVMEGCSSSAGFNGGFALILVAVALAFVLKAKRA